VDRGGGNEGSCSFGWQSICRTHCRLAALADSLRDFGSLPLGIAHLVLVLEIKTSQVTRDLRVIA